MSSAELIASISLSVSIINLVLYYRFSSKSNKPAINHFLKNLPPYSSPKETTEIRIKNEGTAEARIRWIVASFSWDKDLQVVLFDDVELEKKDFLSIAPNEELKYYKTLPEPPSGERQHLTIKTVYDNREKEDVFELGIRMQKSFG
jgi:hypothetical protein